MTTAIKICGLTTADTLDAALDGGADFVGAVGFPKSPRHLAPEAAARLFDRARGRAMTGAGVIKALPIRHGDDFFAADEWDYHADHLMFDAKPPEGSVLPGGVGHSFDWTLLVDRAFRHPWFLAGGLNPDNVAEALRITGAPMLDVSSGVESAPGVKDADRIAAFIQNARRT